MEDNGTIEIFENENSPEVDVEMEDIVYGDVSGKEDKANKTQEINSSSTTVQYPSAKAVYDYAENKENKVTTLSSSSTDTQYPSAKCVYDIVGDISSALDSINGESI